MELTVVGVRVAVVKVLAQRAEAALAVAMEGTAVVARAAGEGEVVVAAALAAGRVAMRAARAVGGAHGSNQHNRSRGLGYGRNPRLVLS